MKILTVYIQRKRKFTSLHLFYKNLKFVNAPKASKFRVCVEIDAAYCVKVSIDFNFTCKNLGFWNFARRALERVYFFWRLEKL